MMKKLFDWLDDRTGCRNLIHEALFERIPGGARWRYVWGSSLVFAFAVQAITGVFLWMAYSPSDSTAWESVYYIEHQMQGGWLLRGVHHFMAQTMVVLLALHLLQVVIDGAYKAPREVNFWLGLILMQIVLGLSLTGYLLPWDQKGYWATRVATNLMGLVPVVGEGMQRVVVGGADYNHHTVTRFFALHAGVLPALLVGFLVLHLAVFRRHGICAKQPLKKPEAMFWPDQVLRDAVVCLAALLVVFGLIWHFQGAELTAPADGAKEYSAARPEWYFLFLFQFLKLFEGMGETGEFIGAIVVPGAVVGVLFLMPFIGRWKIGHYFNVAFIFALLAGAGVLTGMAVHEDQNNSGYKNAVWVAHQNAELAQSLAGEGIPPEGARQMMRNHPQAQALRVITETCLKCHSYADDHGHGYTLAEPAAPNLYNYGRAAWIEGLLDPKQIVGHNYFGGTELKEGEMVGFVTGGMQDAKETFTPQAIKQIAAALARESGLETHKTEDVAAGIKLITQGDDACINCHKFQDEGGLGGAPDLTGWASREWLVGMIQNPNDERFYGYLAGEGQNMPAFGTVADDPHSKNLSPEVLGYIAGWLRGEWYKQEEAPAKTEDAKP